MSSISAGIHLSQAVAPKDSSWLIEKLFIIDGNTTSEPSTHAPIPSSNTPDDLSLHSRDANDDSILIQRGIITDRGPHALLKERHPEVPVVDGTGYMVYPGLVNGHTHCAMGFFRGLGHGVDQMIQRLFFPVESSLDETMIESLSLGYMLSGLQSGVTFFADHYYFVAGVGRALDRLGMRGAIAETIADRGGAHPSYASFERAQRHLDRWPHSSRVRPAAGPHATDTVSLQLLKEVAQWARHHQLPVHMHLGQTSLEWAAAQSHQKTPVALAADAGLLSDRTLVVHLLHRTEEDLMLLGHTGTTVGVCPSSQIIYERLTDLTSLDKNALPLVIGTDCAASSDHCNVLDELRTFALLSKDRQCAPEFYSPKKLFAMATDHAYRVFCPELSIGSIRPGQAADLVFSPIDVSLLPLHEPLTNLIYSAASKNVKHVMIDGRWVLWDGQPVLISLETISQEYKTAVARIHQLCGHLFSPHTSP